MSIRHEFRFQDSVGIPRLSSTVLRTLGILTPVTWEWARHAYVESQDRRCFHPSGCHVQVTLGGPTAS